MKKKFINAFAARQWNRLLSKFRTLRQRIKQGSADARWLNSEQHHRLVGKLQGIYAKLERLQHSVGLKLAGTTLALSLTAATAQAQSFDAEALIKIKQMPIDMGQNSAPSYADIDTDGDLDLYVGYADGTIKIFTNDGGVFTVAAELQAGGSTLDVGSRAFPSFADIDTDGDLDLYVGEYYGTIKIFTNNGGVFTAAGNMQANGSDINLDYFSAPTFQNIDGDSDLDLYVGSNLGTIKIYTNNAGVFTAAGELEAGGSAINVGFDATPTFANIDGDSDLDLYVGERNGTIKVFTNDGGVFTAAGNLTGVNVLNRSIPVFADIDKDTDLDLYVGTGDGNIKVFTNSSATFTAAADMKADDIPLVIGTYAAPTFANIDGDSDLDLYVGNYSGTINVFTNNSGVFTWAGDVQAGGSTLDVGQKAVPTFADIDGDSDLDLYVGNYSGTIKIFTNDGGVFTAADDMKADGNTIVITYGAKPVFADIDGDSDLDLYVGNGGNIKVFTNEGGLFTAAGELKADGSTINVGNGSAPNFADTDNDGDFDLYVGNADGNIKIFTNDGRGIFTAAGNMQAGGNTLDVGENAKPVFADIDGDDDLDLYVGGKDGYTKFFENITTFWTNSWSDGAPTASSHAIINGDYTTSGNLTTNDLIINQGKNITINNGHTITVGGKLLIKSGANGTGSFINNGTINVNGSATVERYLSATDRYYYISPAVSDATASVFGSDLTNAANKLYQTDGTNWTKMETGTDALIPMKGYAFKSGTAGRIISFSGTLNDGNQSIAQSSGMFTLVGNPYPSAIDWGNNTDVPSSLNSEIATIYYRVGGSGEGSGTGNFVTYNRLVSNDGPERFVPAMQAFWVENAGSNPVTVGNDARVHNGQAFYKSANLSKGIYLVINDGDEALIAFNPNADSRYNSTKMFADGLPQIYTLLNAKQMAINTFTGIESNLSLSVAIKVATAGAQSIAMKDFNDFDASVSVYLEDKLTGTMHNLRSGVYSFDATEGTVNNRFVLHLTQSTTNVTDADKTGINVYAYDKMVYVSLSGKQTTSSEVSVFDVAGRLVAAKNLSDFQNLTGLHIAQTGVYVVKVSTASGVMTHKIVIE